MKPVIILCGVFASLLAAGAADNAQTLNQAVQKLVAVPDPPFGAPLSVHAEYNAAWIAVTRLGSDDEIRAALWKILNDESQVSNWQQAFHQLFNYGAVTQVLMKDSAAWVRRNLDRLLLGDRAMLSAALVVLNATIEESDAQLFRDAAGRLPAGNETEKKRLLAMAEGVPERISYRLLGEAYTRDMNERLARGDRSPEVLGWNKRRIEREEEDQKNLEVKRKFIKAIRAGASPEEAGKAALEGLSLKSSEPPQPGKSSSSSGVVPSKKPQASAPAQGESPGQSKSNSTDSAHETSSQGWLTWLVLAFAAAIGAAWLFLRKSKP